MPFGADAEPAFGASSGSMDPVDGPAGFVIIGLLQTLAVAWFARRSGIWRWLFAQKEGRVRRRRLVLGTVAYLFLMTPVIVAAVEAA